MTDRDAELPCIEHDAARRRFTTRVEDLESELDYTLADGVMTITHTGVPSSLNGRGIAATLMKTALQVARSAGWKVNPVCSYAVAYMRKHPEES